jgi:peptidoglycan hydrolase-like protein with peptidoglycan-binding domain
MQRTILIVAVLSAAFGLSVAAAQSVSPKPMSAVLSIKAASKPSLYSRAQAKLKSLGAYLGPVNGKRDDATITAIKKFQIAQKLPVSGRLTPETLRALGV